MSEIVTAGNPILSKKAAAVPLDEIGAPATRKIITRMKVALATEPLGVAIAAPQVGESLRIFVVSGKALAKRSGTEHESDGHATIAPLATLSSDRTYINPEILKTSRKKKEMHEGCLSVRGKSPDMMAWGTVIRAEKIKIRAYDETGVLHEHNASGFLSQVFQHEIDHLEGILYIEKAEQLYEEKTPKTE